MVLYVFRSHSAVHISIFRVKSFINVVTFLRHIAISKIFRVLVNISSLLLVALGAIGGSRPPWSFFINSLLCLGLFRVLLGITLGVHPSVKKYFHDDMFCMRRICYALMTLL